VFVDESRGFDSTPPKTHGSRARSGDARYVIWGRDVGDYEESDLPFSSVKSREIEGERTLWYYYLLFVEWRMRQGPQNPGCYYTIGGVLNDEKVT